MKKYKLIKEYPSSPGLYSIIKKIKNTDYYEIITENVDNSRKIHESHIKKFPEFWQEIIEKDYEILEFDSTDGVIYNKIGYNIWGNNLNTVCTNKSFEEFCDPKTITKVKRLSDGEFFEVGDWVEHIQCGNVFQIDKIYDSGTSFLAIGYDTDNEKNDRCIDLLKKIKTPIIKNWTDEDMIGFAQQAINNLTKRGIFDKELDKLPEQLKKFKNEIH